VVPPSTLVFSSFMAAANSLSAFAISERLFAIIESPTSSPDILLPFSWAGSSYGGLALI